MPVVMGAAVSYSPLLYRERSRWTAVSDHLREGVIQPKASRSEDDSLLDDYNLRIAAGLDALHQAIGRSSLDALILITADRGSQFDSSHVPQIHIQAGGEVWGDPALAALDEVSRRSAFFCEEQAAGILVEELVRDGFDLAEAKNTFRPVGDPQVGITPAAVEAAGRLAGNTPIIPISLNCHVRPLINGARVHRFGVALARAAALTEKRLGILVSGGLSGDAYGPMSGWIDDVFDRWVLARIERGRAADLARVWDVPSRNLLGVTSEVRLWTAAAAALETAQCRATVHDYMPIHAAASGIGFVTWEKN